MTRVRQKFWTRSANQTETGPVFCMPASKTATESRFRNLIRPLSAALICVALSLAVGLQCTANDCHGMDPSCETLTAALLYRRLPRVLYAANFGSNDVSQYTINASSGLLSPAGTIASGAQPFAISPDPTGFFVYSAGNGAGEISTYAISQRDGTLQSMGIATAAPGVQGLSAGIAGRFVYAGMGAGNQVKAFALNSVSGTLSEIQSIAAGTQPNSLAAF